MYDLHSYGRMIADRVRVDAYSRAMKAAIRPGDVVVDLGAGAGYFSILACLLGARKVYAIEPEPSIWVAKASARDLGLEDRIECIQAYGSDLELPERADVVISDLRGGISTFQGNLAAVVDARRRFLREGGVLLPLRDTLHVALVASEPVASWLFSPWSDGVVDQAAARALLANTVHALPRDLLREHDLVTSSAAWATVEYHGEAVARLSGEVSLVATRSAVANGLAVWFDAEITDGIAFSNRPERPGSAYRTMFLPFEEALEIEQGDGIQVALSTSIDAGLWTWEARGAGGREHKQSTLRGELPLPGMLARLSGEHRPYRRKDERTLDRAKSLADGMLTVREIGVAIATENGSDLEEVRSVVKGLGVTIPGVPMHLRGKHPSAK